MTNLELLVGIYENLVEINKQLKKMNKDNKIELRDANYQQNRKKAKEQSEE